MLRFLARRLVGLVLILILVSLVVFAVLNALPGDPASVILGTAARPDTLAALRLELGLDRPFWLRWLSWLAAAATGDFGRSITYGVPVGGLVAQRLAITVPLALTAFAIAGVTGLTLGLVAARRPNGAVDLATTAFAQIGTALPNFWVGLLLILLFASALGWLPAGGFPGWNAGFVAGMKALLLPAIALALPQAAVLTRVTRTALLDTSSQDYMRTARAKGLSRGGALLHHALPNAMIPITTILGLQFSFLVAGTVLVENVFALPGLGQLAYQSLSQRDLVTMQAVALLLAASVVAVSFLVDIAYAWLDPRLRTEP